MPATRRPRKSTGRSLETMVVVRGLRRVSVPLRPAKQNCPLFLDVPGTIIPGMAKHIRDKIDVSSCDTCRQLLKDWDEAEGVLSAAESVLMAAQTASADEFTWCCLVMSNARHRSEHARLVFERHRKTHAAN